MKYQKLTKLIRSLDKLAEFKLRNLPSLILCSPEYMAARELERLHKENQELKELFKSAYNAVDTEDGIKFLKDWLKSIPQEIIDDECEKSSN